MPERRLAALVRRLFANYPPPGRGARTKTAKPRAQLEKHRGSAWTKVKKDRSATSLQVGRNQQQPRVLPHALNAVF